MPKLKHELPEDFLHMDYDTLKDLLTTIPDRYQAQQIALMTTYAGWARGGEIVKGRGNTSNHNPNSLPLKVDKVSAVKSKTATDWSILRLTLMTEKQRMVSPRIAVVYRKFEPWLCEPIIEYWKEQKAEGKTFMFETRNKTPHHIVWLEKAFENFIARPYDFNLYSQNAHLLRMWRSIHASEGHILGGEAVDLAYQKELGGWQSLNTLSKYYNKVKVEKWYQKIALGGRNYVEKSKEATEIQQI